MHNEKTTIAAQHKWKGILQTLGVAASFLDGKHGPCPLCGGTDRWRWDNKEGSGSWICNACGAGRGMDLVMKLTGQAFPDAASRVDEILGNVTADTPTHRREMTDEDHHRVCVSLWRSTQKAEPGDLLHRYLASRGLGALDCPDNLRLHPALKDGEGGIRPAMVARVTGPDGAGATLHRTFLKPDGSGKAEMGTPRKLMPGSIPDGSAIRLGPANRELGIAEGIETALAASILFELPVWAAVNATMLEKWEPPSTTEHVYVFGDCDDNYRGQRAAFTLANRIRAKWSEIEVTVRIPAAGDWNEILNRSPA